MWAKTNDEKLIPEFSFRDLDTLQLQARVRWDGCVHLYLFYNGNESKEADDCDYTHICDLEEFIEQLQGLVKAAREHHGEKWPDIR